MKTHVYSTALSFIAILLCSCESTQHSPAQHSAHTAADPALRGGVEGAAHATAGGRVRQRRDSAGKCSEQSARESKKHCAAAPRQARYATRMRPSAFASDGAAVAQAFLKCASDTRGRAHPRPATTAIARGRHSPRTLAMVKDRSRKWVEEARGCQPSSGRALRCGVALEGARRS